MFGLTVTVFAAKAQVNDEFKSFKPTKKNFTTEVGLAGGLNNADFVLNEGSGLLRFRYFMKENFALRLGLNVSANSNTQKFYGVLPADANKEGESVQRQNTFLVNLGVEKHFTGTPRLSPYVGADLLLGVMTQNLKMTNTDGNAFVDQFSMERTGPGNIAFGLRAVVGADYYIAKHVYLGLEAGLGFLNSARGKTKITTTTGSTTTTNEIKSSGSQFSLQPSIITGIRVGFVF